MEPKLSNYEVIRFLLQKGGRCTNYELVSNFRAILNDPLHQAEARLKFKDIINTVAIVGESQEGKYIELKREYQDNNCSPKSDQNDSGPSSLLSDRSDNSGSYASPLSQTFQPYWRYRLSSSSRVPSLPAKHPDYELVTRIPSRESQPTPINRSVSESVLSESQDTGLPPRRSLGSIGHSRPLSEESAFDQRTACSEDSRSNGYRSYHNSSENMPSRSVSFSHDSNYDPFVRDHSHFSHNDSTFHDVTPMQSLAYSYGNTYESDPRDGSRFLRNNPTGTVPDYMPSRSRAQSCDPNYDSSFREDTRRVQNSSTGALLNNSSRSLSLDNSYDSSSKDENYWPKNKHQQRHSFNRSAREYSSLDYNEQLASYMDESIGLPPPPPPPRKIINSVATDLGKGEMAPYWESGLERCAGKRVEEFKQNHQRYDNQIYNNVGSRSDYNASYIAECNKNKQNSNNVVQAQISKFSSVPQYREALPSNGSNNPPIPSHEGKNVLSEMQSYSSKQPLPLSVQDHNRINELGAPSIKTFEEETTEKTSKERWSSNYQTNSEDYSATGEETISNPSNYLPQQNKQQISSVVPDKTKLSNLEQSSNRNDSQHLSEDEPPVPPERRRKLQDKPSAETRIKADNDNLQTQREKIILVSSGKVKDRVQHFDDMEKRKNTKRCLSPLPDKENRISKGQEIEDNISISVLDPKLKKEWFVKAAQCDYHALVSLLKKEPKLAGIKDIALTALHWAAKQGDANIVKLISGAYKVNPNVRSGGYTPVHLATLYKHDMIVHLLVHTYGADPSIRDYSGKRADQYPDNHVRTVSGVKTMERKPLKPRPLEKEQSSGFIRIGSLNLRKSRKSAVFASVRGSTRSWGSATELRLSNYMSTRKKTPKIQVEKKCETEVKNDSDSDSAYGFSSK